MESPPAVGVVDGARRRSPWYPSSVAEADPGTTSASRRARRSVRRAILPLYRQNRPGMKLLLVSLYFPPAGGAGVQRSLKFATHLPGLGIETHVLAPEDPKWLHRDDELPVPTQAWVHR